MTSLAQNTSPVNVIEFDKIQNGIMDEGKLQKNQLEDYDNNPVCEIKVKAQGFDESILQKLIFVPKNIMIMHKAYENGEYRLYVSSKKPGSIVIKYQGDCEFKLPYNLEPKKIYELVLGMETATLVIRATPEESVIYIDDEKVGTGNVSQAVSIGAEHRYRVECENYFEKEDVVTLQKGERKSLNIELEPAFGFITVKTTPSGADVYIDDQIVGKTPYLSEIIKRGLHKITVNKEGYETAVKRLNINVNEESNVEFVLVEGESSMPVQQVVLQEPNQQQSINQIQKTDKVYEYVDLGLPSGTLWATCNVGANYPAEIGDYFAWGETVTKETYSLINYEFCGGSLKKIKKYNDSSKSGVVDGKTKLELSDDAANVNWGDSWRMPTANDFAELIKCCSWERTTMGEKLGYKITGVSGKSIFLPSTGWRYESLKRDGISGFYWSSSLSRNSSERAYYFYFGDNGVGMESYYNRTCGMAIRPVCLPEK